MGEIAWNREAAGCVRLAGEYRLTLTNDLPSPQLVEIELPLGARAKGARLIKRDGWMLWRVSVPANGSAVLDYAI